jgi:hypothetical protein
MKCKDYIGVLFFQSSGHSVPLKEVKITSVLQDLGMLLQRTYIDPNGGDSKVLSEIFIQQNKMSVLLAMQ